MCRQKYDVRPCCQRNDAGSLGGMQTAERNGLVRFGRCGVSCGKIIFLRVAVVSEKGASIDGRRANDTAQRMNTDAGYLLFSHRRKEEVFMLRLNTADGSYAKGTGITNFPVQNLNLRLSRQTVSKKEHEAELSNAEIFRLA